MIMVFFIMLSACQTAMIEGQESVKVLEKYQESKTHPVLQPPVKPVTQSPNLAKNKSSDAIKKSPPTKGESHKSRPSSNDKMPEYSPRQQSAMSYPSKKVTLPMVFGGKNKTPKKMPPTKDGLATGTGFFISFDGFLLTNEHVINQARDIKVFVGETGYKARVISLNQQDDIAILKIDIKSKPLEIKSSEPLPGTEVSVLGFPNIGIQGNEIKSTFGHVNAASGLKGDPRYLQFSAEIQPGNSGSPVIDKQGYVIGIATSTLNQQAAITHTGALAQSVNYALKAEYAADLLNKSEIFLRSNSDSFGATSRVQLIQRVKESVVLIVAAIGKNTKIPKVKPKANNHGISGPAEKNYIRPKQVDPPDGSMGIISNAHDDKQNGSSDKKDDDIYSSRKNRYHYIHIDKK